MKIHGERKSHNFTNVVLTLIFLSGLGMACCISCTQYSPPPRYRIDIDDRNITNLLSSTVAFVSPDEMSVSPEEPVSDVEWHGPYCAGFFIDETHLISAAHCFQHIIATSRFLPGVVLTRLSPIGTEAFFVEQGGITWSRNVVTATPIPAEVYLWDEQNDVVVLRVTREGFHPRSFSRLSYTVPRRGDEIYHVGHPLTIAWTFFVGFVSNVISTDIREPGMENIIQVSLPISPGCSGGPLIDSNGEVVGIVNSFFGFGSNIGVCRTAPVIRRLIDSEE